jgi:hypothetical protein
VTHILTQTVDPTCVLSWTRINTSTHHAPDLWSTWQEHGAPINPTRLKTVGSNSFQPINTTSTIIFDLKGFQTIIPKEIIRKKVKSFHQGQRRLNQRFVRLCWWSPRQYKEVEFTVPDLAQSEISSARRLRGPRPLKIARTIVQIPKDQWPMSSNRYTLPPRGDQSIPTISNRPYFRACINDY